MTKYNQEIEQKMVLFSAQLSEKNKRHYAAQEVEKLGRGGKSYISVLLNISRPRIERGIKDLTDPTLYEQIPYEKQRRTGGGRKKKK